MLILAPIRSGGAQTPVSLFDDGRTADQVPEGLEGDTSGIQIARHQRTAIVVPPDLRRALGVKGRRAFDALTPGRKKEHLRMLVTAKRPETRAKRLSAIVHAMVE